MIEVFTAAETLPFSIALALMLLVGLVEAVGLGLGAGLDVDAGGDVPGGDALSWLGLGRVPLLILLVAFLACFGLLGLALQQGALAFTGAFLSPWLAAPLAAVAALPATGLAARGLARVLPQDETTAVSIDSLIGRRGVVTLGSARRGAPAQVRVRDAHDHLHHVMVEPFHDDGALREGETVLLVGREGHLFTALGEGQPLSSLPSATHLLPGARP